MSQKNQKFKLHNVLVVDDDPVIRDMMVDILEFEDYPIQLARNGYEALEAMRGAANCVVFLDLMMPVLSGEQVCKILDEEPELRQRHVIVLMSAMDKLEEAASLKADAVLQKPFVVDDVMKVMEEYMG
jgi:CheY-like chemotaxis protein